MKPDANSDRWRYYCAGALLLHMPACLAVASTYNIYRPREFSSKAVFIVNWNQVDGALVRQALVDVAWNHRTNEVEFTSRESSADPPPFGATTFEVSAFASRAENAQSAAKAACNDLTRQFNERYSHRWRGRAHEPTPITFEELANLPAAPARPDIQLVSTLGAAAGLVFVGLGLGVVFQRRAANMS
jgi:hypothetical protein